MKKHKQPEGFAPGIYFNMDEDDYHNDPALSHSGITKILVSEYDYWESSGLNPNRPKFKTTDAMEFGKLAELYLLEEKRFLKTYNVAGGGWSADKKTISSTDFENVKQSAEMLRRDKDTASYFTHGYPQVSIFYTHPSTGMRMRIRTDWLRTFGCIDLKRYKDLRVSRLGWSIVEHGLDLQEQMYTEGILLAKEALRAGKIKAHGDYDPAWLKGFMEDPDAIFRFIFQRSVKPYIYDVWFFDQEILKTAAALVEEGIHKYAKAIEAHGVNEWPCGSPKPREFSNYHLPRRAYDR